jgi:RNA polymerase sigma-70 factor (ECF subfamily)
MYEGKIVSEREQRELIRLAKECDPSAFARIYDYFYEDVYNYICHRVAVESVAEDLTAEVFLKALESIDSYTFRGTPLVAWLFRIARNIVIDYWRGPGPTEVPLEEEILHTEEGAEDAFERQFTQQQLVQALSHLTEDQQDVIVLRIVDGFSVMDVAQILDKSETAIKALQRRALGSLNRALGGFFPDMS